MSDRTEALAFLNLVSHYRQERQLDALKDKTDEANSIQQGIAQSARRQRHLARRQERKRDQLEFIRQRAFEASKDIGGLKALLEDPEYAQYKLADHVAYTARSLGMRLQSEGVAVENVAEYADKERVDAIYTDLAHAYNAAVARLTHERRNELELAFRCRAEMWRLKRLLELEAKWRNVQRVKTTLEPLCEERKRIRAELEAVKAKPFFGFGLGARRARHLSEESDRLRQQIVILNGQAEDISENELKSLRAQFGHQTVEELTRTVQERTMLIASFESAVDYEEKPLFRQAPTNAPDAREQKAGAQNVLPPVQPPLGLFAVCKSRGHWFHNWSDYIRELVAQQPEYEDMLGGVDGEAGVVMAEVEKGAYFVLLGQAVPIIVLSKRLPVSFVADEYFKLYDRILQMNTPTVGWMKNLNTPPTIVSFEQALTEG